MARVAIIGAGNLGAFLAAHLLRAGHSAFFCVRRPVAGLCVDGLGPVDAPAYQDHPPPADIVNSADADDVLRILASYPPGTRTSMLQDRERGRPLEIDALNGALVMLGRRYGLPVSVNEELVARLRAESDKVEGSGGMN